jgi:hypothetical protein
MAKIVVSSITSTSVTVYLGELDTGYVYKDRRLHWYVNNEETSRAQIAVGAGASKSADVEIDGLSPNTTYTIKVYIVFQNDESWNQWKEITVTTKSSPDTPTRPSKFSWSYKKTENLYLSADEWNGLTENINAVRNYKDLSSFSFTTAEKKNRLTAVMYNQVVNAIKGISGYGTSLRTVSPGEEITAELLDDLVSAINEVQ